MISTYVTQLVQYGLGTGLLPEWEKIYATNQILKVMGVNEFEEVKECRGAPLQGILKGLLDEAVRLGRIHNTVTERDLFDTRLMNCLVPRPVQVQRGFWKRHEKSPWEATDYDDRFSQDTDYIRYDRICKERKGGEGLSR